MKPAIWQTTQLDAAIAEEFFGWRWYSFFGVPNCGHPGYPGKARVREFMSPKRADSPHWDEPGAAAGNEPLAYCYESSMGPESVPHFSGHYEAIADLEREIRKRGLWGKYRSQLWAQVSHGNADINEERLADASCETRCIAALAIIGSKYVGPSPIDNRESPC